MITTEIQKFISLSAKKIIDADIKALPTTAIELIAAPGPNKIIVPFNVHCHFLSTVAYTNMDANMTFALMRGTAGGNIFTADMIDGGLGNAASIDWNMIQQQIMDLPADIINKALYLKLTNGIGGNLTGGAAGNALTITTAYYVLHV